jgi:hypothetical protein
MSYPRTIDDLKPSQLVSDPIVTIDYDLLDGLPSEAREAILKAVAVMERLSDDPSPRKDVVAYRRPLTGPEADRALRIAQDDWNRCSENYDRALRDPSQFTPLLLSEINGWAIKEDRPPIASDQDRL